MAEVLRGSDSVTVSEDGKQVRRTSSILSAEDIVKQVDSRSLFASPFPFDTTLDAATAFFNTVAPVNCVRFRRHLASGDFRGSVFVEFASEELATEVRLARLEASGMFHMQLVKYLQRHNVGMRSLPPFHACTSGVHLAW